MSHGFYRAFEERHRGSRAVVKDRLRAYLPFLEPVARRLPGAPSVDLGCGRGEWVELLGELGLRPHGVDLDDGMLAGCREAGLSVEKADALAHLAALPDASQAIVSAFHLVEHLSFDDVQTIVTQALRVLVPGGLLVLETPNPENIVVGTSNFYLDPTHLKPLPPLMLSFLPEYAGFARVKTVRLQEPEALHAADAHITLYDVLGSASPDYAVVAQKSAAQDVMETLDAAFAREYGIDTASLAKRMQEQADAGVAALQNGLATANAELARAQAQLASAENRIQHLEASLGKLDDLLAAQASRVEEVDARVMAWSELSAAQKASLEEIDARVLIWSQLAAAKSDSRSGFRSVVRRLVESNPGARLRIVNAARRLGLHGAIRRIYWWLTNRQPAALSAEAGGLPFPPPDSPARLSPRAADIHARLKAGRRRGRG